VGTKQRMKISKESFGFGQANSYRVLKGLKINFNSFSRKIILNITLIMFGRLSRLVLFKRV